MPANDVISAVLISNNTVTETSRTQRGNILHEITALMLINQEGELLKRSAA